jgi:hypothetical protein
MNYWLSFAKGLDTTVVEATYLVDAAVLRAHVSSRGDTLREESLRRYEYQHRLAQERARRFPSQQR